MDANIDRQGYCWKQLKEFFNSDKWRWTLGLIYIVAVAGIWIAASYIVQSVVDSGVSPFLITYICNSLFVVYIPIVEVSRYFEDSVAKLLLSFNQQKGCEMSVQNSADLETVNLLQATDSCRVQESKEKVSDGAEGGEDKGLLDSKGRWTRTRMAKVSILICPFWFFAQLTFNLSLKYTTVAVKYFCKYIFLTGSYKYRTYHTCFYRLSSMNKSMLGTGVCNIPWYLTNVISF